MPDLLLDVTGYIGRKIIPFWLSSICMASGPFLNCFDNADHEPAEAAYDDVKQFNWQDWWAQKILGCILRGGFAKIQV